MWHNDIHEVFLRKPQQDGSMKQYRAGRFMVRDGEVHHLEDYHGIIKRALPEGPVDHRTVLRLQSLKRNPYLHILSHSEDNLDLSSVPEAELPAPPQHAPPRPPSVFHYHRVGMDKPHVLEVRGSEGLLDGRPLAPEELSTIHDNVLRGAATLRYRKAPASMHKMERVFEELRKDEQKSKRKLDPLYEDPMVPGVGNKLALKDFVQKSPAGVAVVLDGNDFHHINEQYGNEAGDAAAIALGRAAHESIDDLGGSLFRKEGDKFIAHLPSTEHAARFVRALRDKLERVPPVGGVHAITASIGLGLDVPAATVALQQAKAQKWHPQIPAHRVYPVGDVPMLVYSMLPGSEGPVPLASKFTAIPASLRPQVSSTPTVTAAPSLEAAKV